MRLCFLLLLAILVSKAAARCTDVSPDTRFSLPRDMCVHLEQRYESWFLQGSLESVEHDTFDIIIEVNRTESSTSDLCIVPWTSTWSTHISVWNPITRLNHSWHHIDSGRNWTVLFNYHNTPNRLCSS